MRQLIEELVAQINSEYSVHDFRLVRGASNTKLVFDLATPYCDGTDAHKIKEALDSQLAQRQLDYRTIIRFDQFE